MSIFKVIIVLLLITCLPVFAALKPGVQSPDFRLQDAYDKSYTLREMRDKIVILLIGTRKAREEGDKWMLALNRDYGQYEGIKCYLIADLRGLPFFVTEGMVKWGVKREEMPFTTLLDWDGKIAQKYNAKKDLPNLFIIDRQGKIVYSYSGTAEFSNETYSRFQEKLNSIIIQNRLEQYQKLFRLSKEIIWNMIVCTFGLFLN